MRHYIILEVNEDGQPTYRVWVEDTIEAAAELARIYKLTTGYMGYKYQIIHESLKYEVQS